VEALETALDLIEEADDIAREDGCLEDDGICDRAWASSRSWLLKGLGTWGLEVA